MQLSVTGANYALDGLCGAPVDSGGTLLFHEADDDEVADCPLNTDAFAASSGGTATMNTGSTVQDTTTIAGTIDHAHLVENDTPNTILAQFTCGEGSGEIQFSSLTFGTDETLTVQSFSITFTSATID